MSGPLPPTNTNCGVVAKWKGRGLQNPYARVRFSPTPPLIHILLMVPLQIADIIITILLGASILLQQRGSGLGDAFGNDSAVYTSRRGAERVLYYLSIIFGVSFIILGILQLVLAK